MKSFNKLVTATAGNGKVAAVKDIKLSNFVPDGKHLYLEYVSTSSEMPPGQKPSITLVVLTTGGGLLVQHYPVAHYQLKYAGSDRYQSSARVYGRLSNEDVLRVDMVRDSTKGKARCFCGLSGYIDK
jgi:hypothetical protein